MKKYNVKVTTTITNYFEVNAEDKDDARTEAFGEQNCYIREMRGGKIDEESIYEIKEVKE